MRSRHHHRIVTASAFLALIGLVVFAVMRSAPNTQAFQPQAVATEQSLPCCVQFVGAYSEIKVKRFKRITDRESWIELWKEHKGENLEKNMTGWPVVPRIDFDECMVIALLGGIGSQCNGFGFSYLDDMGDHLRLRYAAHTFQIGVGPDDEFDESKYRGTPYGFFVIPKSKKMIIVERDARSLIRSDPVWKESYRFPAM